MSDAALDRPVRILAREFLGIGTRVRMGRTVGVTLERNGGHGDDRTFGESFLELVVFSLAFSQPQPPAIVVNRDRDVIRVIEGRCAAGPPNELREIAPSS